MLNTTCQQPIAVRCLSLSPVSTGMLSPFLRESSISMSLPSTLATLTLLPVSPSSDHLRSENDDFVVSTPNRSASSTSSWSGPGTSGSAPQSTPRCSTPHTPGSQSHSSGYGTPTGSGLRRKDLSFGFAADSDEGSSLFGTPYGTPRGERGDRSDRDDSPGSSTW